MSVTTQLDRESLTQELTIRGWKDPAFKELLETDPKAALEEHLGHSLPEEVAVLTHMEDTRTIHLVLPHFQQEPAVSDAQIEWLMDQEEILVGASDAGCSHDAANSTCTCSGCKKTCSPALSHEDEKPQKPQRHDDDDNAAC